jgi:hypothetical protein
MASRRDASHADLLRWLGAWSCSPAVRRLLASPDAVLVPLGMRWTATDADGPWPWMVLAIREHDVDAYTLWVTVRDGRCVHQQRRGPLASPGTLDLTWEHPHPPLAPGSPIA